MFPLVSRKFLAMRNIALYSVDRYVVHTRSVIAIFLGLLLCCPILFSCFRAKLPFFKRWQVKIGNEYYNEFSWIFSQNRLLYTFGNWFESGILLPNCSDLLWEKLFLVIEKNFWKAEGREFAKILRSLEQFIQTVKGQNFFDNRMLF